MEEKKQWLQLSVCVSLLRQLFCFLDQVMVACAFLADIEWVLPMSCILYYPSGHMGASLIP